MKKIVLTLIFIIFIIVLYLFLNEKDNTSMVSNYKLITFNEINESLYFNCRVWGISGNHEEIVLSSILLDKDNWVYDKNEVYVFYTSELYYKILKPNVLAIYAPSSTIGEKPINFIKTEIKIELIELKTYDEIQDYSKNYQKYGLEKMSIYLPS